MVCMFRYPYSEGGFLEAAAKYISSRARMLEDAALSAPDPGAAEALLHAAEEHQRNLLQYTQHSLYHTALKSLATILQYFEHEFEEERVGLWLGGLNVNAADIYLGTKK